jgi:hypothetical protein
MGMQQRTEPRRREERERAEVGRNKDFFTLLRHRPPTLRPHSSLSVPIPSAPSQLPVQGPPASEGLGVGAKRGAWVQLRESLRRPGPAPPNKQPSPAPIPHSSNPSPLHLPHVPPALPCNCHFLPQLCPALALYMSRPCNSGMAYTSETIEGAGAAPVLLR